MPIRLLDPLGRLRLLGLIEGSTLLVLLLVAVPLKHGGGEPGLVSVMGLRAGAFGAPWRPVRAAEKDGADGPMPALVRSLHWVVLSLLVGAVLMAVWTPA